MRRAFLIAVMTLAALLAVSAGPGFGAAAGKSGGVPGGKGAERMTERGRANTNAQWSADPERGWVRADERRRSHEQSEPPEKRSNGQQKGKGKSTRGY